MVVAGFNFFMKYMFGEMHWNFLSHDSASHAPRDWCTSWATDQADGPDGGFSFDCFDAVVPFFKSANMTVRTNGILASAHNTCLPKWLLDGYKAKKFSKKQLQLFLENRIKAVVPHWLASGLPFHGMIAVNEGFWNQEMPKYGQWPSNWVFGPDMNMFRWVHVVVCAI